MKCANNVACSVINLNDFYTSSNQNDSDLEKQKTDAVSWIKSDIKILKQ